tara:strand:- start:893 stop:1573 length:681 start_codon:yes stop_codon:yes gene_type:complete
LNVFGILLAAGLSERFESDKLFVLYKDKELIRYPLETFFNCDEIDSVVIVCNKTNIEKIKKILNSYVIEKKFEIVLGGKTRHESEVSGINTLKKMKIASNDLVAIHDCARSFLQEDLLNNLITEAKIHGSCSPYLETSLYCKSSHELLTNNLVEIQTPQIFQYGVLQDAYFDNSEEEMNSHDTTQQVSKNLDIESKVILGSELNLKITYKEDLETIKLKLEEYENK